MGRKELLGERHREGSWWSWGSPDHRTLGRAGASALWPWTPQVIGGRAPAAPLSIHGVAPWLLPARVSSLLRVGGKKENRGARAQSLPCPTLELRRPGRLDPNPHPRSQARQVAKPGVWPGSGSASGAGCLGGGSRVPREPSEKFFGNLTVRFLLEGFAYCLFVCLPRGTCVGSP